jgi:hypothetical protein
MKTDGSEPEKIEVRPLEQMESWRDERKLWKGRQDQKGNG